MTSQLTQGFSLGSVDIHPATGLVTDAAGTRRLPPRPLRVLLVLAENAGEVVSHETLLEQVWGTPHANDKALRRAVSDIRHQLGDNAANPVYVETLPRRGYRLLLSPGPLRQAPPAQSPGPPDEDARQRPDLFTSLKQRGVLETIAAYMVAGWLIIQVADIVFDQLMLPPWTGQFVTLLVIAGFPIAVLLSWFLEFRQGRAVLDMNQQGETRRRAISGTYISVVGAMTIAAIGVFFYDQNIGLPGSAAPGKDPGELDPVDQTMVLPPISDNSMAVLPFLNIDGSEETQIFANGLVDDITTRLARVPGLLVSARGDASSMHPNSPSQRVRDRLRVALYLEGSVQISKKSLRIIVQLIDSATGFHVVSRRFDRPREDFFDIRDEITELTVANVRVALPPEVQAPATVASSAGDGLPDPSLDAYTLYRRGVEASREPTSVESVNEALAWFDAALAVDPDYAAALAAKCVMFVEAYPVTDNPAYIERAEASCANALQLNSNLDIVHTAVGDLYRATGRYKDARQSYLRALAINPESVESLTGIGTNYMLEMIPDEAEKYFRQAIGLHPGDWSAYNSLGRFLFHSGRFADAAREYARVVALDNSNVFGYSNLGSAYMLDGDFQSAADAFNRAIELEPRANTYSNLGLIYYYLGQYDEAIAIHREALALAPGDYLNWSNLGDALWHAGRHDEAVSAFARAEVLANDALAVNPRDSNTLIDLAWISTMLGKSSAASEFVHRARQQSPEDPHVNYINGMVLLHNGQVDAAVTALQQAVSKGYAIQLMAAEPNLAQLRHDQQAWERIYHGDSGLMN